VGDVHGRLDLLSSLVKAIEADLRGSHAERKVVIFLGDYIDRGPDSSGVLTLLASRTPSDGVEWRFLKGNHEQAMIEFLDDPSSGARWCEYGGDRALQSWGLRVPELAHRTEAWGRVAADLRHKLSKRETDFLEGLELSVTVGDYFFSHAGARPGVALDRQASADLMWIRQPFLNSSAPFERMVVHGHTPTPQVYADQRRIGIDTKAYETGVLTALRLEGGHQTILQAIGPRRGSPTESGTMEYQLPSAADIVLQVERLEPFTAQSAR
jgi:serine/threonine protein phosphatase 1